MDEDASVLVEDQRTHHRAASIRLGWRRKMFEVDHSSCRELGPSRTFDLAVQTCAPGARDGDSSDDDWLLKELGPLHP